MRIAFEKLRSGEVPLASEPPSELLGGRAEPKWTLRELIEAEESHVLEFKASAFYSYRPDVPERAITEGVIKTVAAFLNSEGGILAIGISDDHEVLGIRPDLDHKNLGTDRYVNALTTLLMAALGPAAAARVRIDIQDLDGEPVSIINVPPSPEPVFAKTTKGNQVFYVRINNTTRILEGKDMVSYIKSKWG